MTQSFPNNAFPVDMAPADFVDPVIEAYKKDVDRTLLRENLKLSVEERILKAESFHRCIDDIRKGTWCRERPDAGQRAKS